MSDKISPAPREPHTNTTPAPIVEASHGNSSMPVNAPATTENVTSAAYAPATVPAQITVPSTTTPTSSAPAPAPAAEESLSLNQKLNAVDRYWKFKAVFHVVGFVVGLVGIGAVSWIVGTEPKWPFQYGTEEWSFWPSLLTFCISALWLFDCLIVLIVRKRPIHPGLRVTMDLLLSIGFCFTAIIILQSWWLLADWGMDGDIDVFPSVYNEYGSYELADNGTWVWENSRNSYYGSTGRLCSVNSTNRYFDLTGLRTCAEQDAYVNKMWNHKPHREAVAKIGLVCQFFMLGLHFILFVWDCIDTHYRRRSKISQDAEKLAAGIVQQMISNGAIIPPPGQPHMRTNVPWGYYPLPMHNGPTEPMADWYRPPLPPRPQAPYQPPVVVAPPVTGPSTEKSAGPRYA